MAEIDSQFSPAGLNEISKTLVAATEIAISQSNTAILHDTWL